MIRRITQKMLSFLLAVVMIVSVLPQITFAASTNYDDFMEDLKHLEIYADEYANSVNRDPGELVLNYIRTGVERYQDDNWNTLAGYEIVGFTNYVKAADGKNGTSVEDLRDIVIDEFYLPNGDQTDFGHMFGCMNISYLAKGSADLSGWAGDLCDLLQYSVANIDAINANTDGTVESMAAYIQENCFGVDASGAFGWDDFYADMDAYYLISEYNKGSGLFSELMEAYFTDGLDDTDRTVYFMNNRFAVADSQEAVRKAIYESYSSDVSIKVLEAGRGLSSYNALREACCYAFADYVYSKAAGQLVEGTGGDETASNGYYSIFSNEHSILAPGIEQDINYAQTVDGKQIVYYVATVDVNRDDVDLLVNYNNNQPPVAGENIALQKVEDQTKALVKNYRDKGLYENFNAIVATNGAGYNITNGTPAGLVVMEGVEYYPVGDPGFFAILDDGTAMIGTKQDYEARKDEIKEGIQAFGSVLVKDGKVSVTKNANYTSSRASRTAIGITAEGKVVMMVLDGRQLPRSAGGAMEEIAQIMLEAGCVDAVNLDGGGSTTYLSKPAGSDDIQLMNVPSDGYARSVATSLVAVSTAAPSTAFDHAVISSDYEYITAGTSMQFSVTGVSNTGNAADIPEGSYWQVSDESLATIDENGLFTAVWSDEGAVVGDVTVQYIVNGEVAGSKVIHVVIPDDMKFVEDRISAIYGVPKQIDVTVWYQGYPVAFTPLMEVILCFPDVNDDGEQIFVMESNAGTIEGLTFTGNAAGGVRTKPVIAMLATANGDMIMKTATINLYHKDEATFDFENATQGNRQLAWYREIENAKTTDNQRYRISDPDSPVEIDYTFALDLTAIDIPAQLEPLKSMLPTYQEGASAWNYMLQLAERVCTQTSVTIAAEFSKDLEVDISNLKVVNEYFELSKEPMLDENNVLTIVCNWKNQSQPIDPVTANPLCILSGIKATVKDTAAYYNNEVLIVNNGYVNYDIYLAASSLYSFAQNPENQANYSLYPYIHEEDCRSDFSDAEDDETTAANNDKGAHFSSQYVDFADTFVVNTEIRQGWHEEDGGYYYYVDNEALTGTQLVPDRKDSSKMRFYEFDETGMLVSEQGATGLIELGDDLYYSVLGVAQTGWQQIDGNNYYFHPDTGKAVDGEYTIREKMNPAVTTGYITMVDYTYTFTDHVLTLGDWVYDTNINGNDGKKHTGWRYRWAGDWAEGWFEVQGEYYFAAMRYPRMIYTGYQRVMKQDATSTSDTQYHLFDDRGVLQKDYTDIYFDGTNYAYLRNGVRHITAGLYEVNGYYYYVNNSTGNLYTNTDLSINSYWANGLVPAGTYHFDEQGRMTNAPVKVTQAENGNIKYSVTNRVVTITTNTNAYRVGYMENGKYVPLVANDGTHSFAVPQNVNKVLVVLAGDANADGVVTADDIAPLSVHLLGITDMEDPAALFAADANGDGRISVSDLARLNAISKGKTTGW